jgi:hypothetical protein
LSINYGPSLILEIDPRFIRKNVDPMPLAAHGLTKELLNRLSSAGNRQVGLNSSVTGTPGAGASSTPGDYLIKVIALRRVF